MRASVKVATFSVSISNMVASGYCAAKCGENLLPLESSLDSVLFSGSVPLPKEYQVRKLEKNECRPFKKTCGFSFPHAFF